MVLKVCSVCLMVLDLDRKKANLIRLWILCVQEPTGEMPNNFPTQTYLKINVRVLVTERAWRHRSSILGSLPGMGVSEMVRAEAEVGTARCISSPSSLAPCGSVHGPGCYGSFSPKERSLCPWGSGRRETELITHGFLYSQRREMGVIFLTLMLSGLGWSELHNKSICFSVRVWRVRPFSSAGEVHTASANAGSDESVLPGFGHWSHSDDRYVVLDQATLAQAKDDLQFATHFSETCDLCNTDLRRFLWVLSFVDFYCFSNLIIIHYFCLAYFDAASSVSSYCVRHCGEESWDIEWMKNIGWDWLRCREAKPIMIKDVMLMLMLINKTGTVFWS